MTFAFHKARKPSRRARAKQKAVFVESEKLEQGMARTILDEVKALQGEAKLKDIARLISEAPPEQVLELMNEQGVLGIGTSLEPQLVQGASAGAKTAAAELGKVVVIDMRRPGFQSWLSTTMGNLVKDTTGTSMDALRTTLTDGIQRGRNPLKLAKDLKQSIGLTDPHAKAVIRRRADLIAQGVSEARADELTERYREKLLKLRARTIARTESLQAVNGGREQLWQQLVEEGAFEEGQEKEWLTAGDERTSEEHAAWEGMKVPVGEDFPQGAPPTRPNCRCTVVLA